MKKFLSMVLTLALVLSLIPAVFAAGEAESVVTYKFNALPKNSGTNTSLELASLTYENTAVTGGLWEYVANSEESETLTNSSRPIRYATNTTQLNFYTNPEKYGSVWIAFKLEVPETGKYDVSVNAQYGSTPELDGDKVNKIQAYIFKTGNESGEDVKEAILSGINSEEPLESRNMIASDKSTAVNFDLGCEDFDEGEYYFVFNPYINYTPATGNNNCCVYLRSLTLTKKSDEQVIADAFTTEEPTVTEYQPSVSGAGYNASEGTATVEGITETYQETGDYKGTYKMSAPEKNGDAQFLYWAKGLSLNKKIVSYENEFYYTPAGGDNNILIAVYDEADGTSNKAEFYNANGQLIKLITNESVDKAVPPLPSMAGYNTASSWKQYNGDTEVTVGSELEPEGTMIFVAQYESEKPINVTVTVENGNGTATVPYGEEVTCTADASKGQLKWWKKEVNGVSEIVSIDETYSFLAWENCTVTAEYADEKPAYTGNKMKIIIDTFTAGNEKAVMAEFIGFDDNTVEKGIMIGTNKIAMTKPGNQFTVTGNVGDTFKGYAIVKDGEEFNLIVDGEATIK